MLAKMAEEQRARKSERGRLRVEREEAALQKGKAKGEEFYYKLQAEFVASTEKAR